MNMKKKLLIPVALVFCVAFASCDSKLCYCYENGHEEELYVSSDVACSAYSTSRKGCVESNERMDPTQIANEQKKQHSEALPADDAGRLLLSSK